MDIQLAYLQPHFVTVGTWYSSFNLDDQRLALRALIIYHYAGMIPMQCVQSCPIAMIAIPPSFFPAQVSNARAGFSLGEGGGVSSPF